MTSDRVRRSIRQTTTALWLGFALPAGVLMIGASPAHAQQISLVADQVQVIDNTGLQASGNVVVIYGDIRLSARQVTYNKTTDSLIITGPITIAQGDGTVLVAEAAELSADLRNGILTSARVVLDQQLQIAAAQINRAQGRYTQMTRVTASSCQVCKSNPVPLWQIRADRVVHDEVERQLYFHGAQLRLADIPIFYLPRLRLPDPTLTRATGFLPPKIRTNSRLGVGVLVPYFIRIGDHADLTVAPLIASQTSTVELRYRQAFHNGDVIFQGALSRDTIVPDTTRFYLFGQGQFSLPRDLMLNFELQETSDTGYLLDYDYSDQDRLRNSVNIMRARRDEFVFGSLTRYDTLRDSEIPISDQLPFAQIDTFYERRLFPRSNADILGRDVARLGAAISWHRDWVTASGLLIEADAGVETNVYLIEEDSRFATEQSFITPYTGVTLRWPLSRVTGAGTVDILEPVAHLAWSEQVGADVPNEDSVFVEFDEANLFELNRFPGKDRREEGLRGALGVNWTRYTPSGLSFTLGAGRVFRADDYGQFTDASGLSGLSSDWLIGAHVNLGGRFALQARALVNDDFDVTKSETRAAFMSDELELGAAHIWVVDDLAEGRPDPTHELRVDGAYQISDFWLLSADGSFDLEADQATRAGLSLQYQNECVPTTDFGLQIELTGFGGAQSTKVHRCGR